MATTIFKEFTVTRDGKDVLHRHTTVEDERNTASLDLAQLDDDLDELAEMIAAYKAVRDDGADAELQASLVNLSAAIEEIQNDFLLAEDVDDTEAFEEEDGED